MFTLGHKALIINKARPGDVISAAQCTINGFCDYLIANAKGNATEGGTAFFAAATPGVNSSGSFTVPALTIAGGEAVQVVIGIRQTRYVSDLSSDFIKQGDNRIFSTAALPAGATPTQIATAIAAGWAAYLDVFHIHDTPYLSVTDAGLGVVDIALQPNNLYFVPFVQLLVVPPGTKTQTAVPNPVAIAPIVIGDEGSGQGKFLEESIRTASYTNMDPYANKPHGSDSVDVRGQYNLYEFQTNGTADGWAPHANLGNDIADQDVQSRGQKFTIYANVDDAPLNAALTLWINAVIAK